MARTSYFEEKRSKYTDPQFFNKINAIDDIIKNLKRIVTDIYFDLIPDTDYVYFTNNNIIQNCIKESYIRYKENLVCVNSLNYYINGYLINGIIPFGTDLESEKAMATKMQVTFNKRAYTWKCIYDLFYAIAYSQVDPKEALSHIKELDKYAILDL